MTFFSRLFSKSSDDYLAKGDRLFEQKRFFEARTVYEGGLQRLQNANNENNNESIILIFNDKIIKANRELALLNVGEAEFALARGDRAKAAEHLELAKTLTDDNSLREKAEALLVSFMENTNETSKLAPAAKDCHSCGSFGPELNAATSCDDADLSPMDYFDLLIRQLPGEMYNRYATLGEKFAYMYLAESRDEHERALELLEDWHDGSSRDIYCYEKGLILHRLGDVRRAKTCFQDAIKENAANPLPYLGLALLLIDSGCFDEAASHLDTMISNEILLENAILLRGEICQHIGDLDGAINRYGMLLSTSIAKTAAEKLYVVLTQCGRQQEAEAVFKGYLKGCKH
jgi:tetratricopeptide (TPR) repeat protein